MQGPGGSSSSQLATDSRWRCSCLSPIYRCQYRVEGASYTQGHIAAKERRRLLPGPSAMTSDPRTVTLFVCLS